MKKEKNIDCLLIGHNEMEFEEYEAGVRRMGLQSGAYRDLSLNFIYYNRRPYTLPEIFNIFHYPQLDGRSEPGSYLHAAESFSAAIAHLGTYLHRRGYTFDYVGAFQPEQALLAEKLQKENILTIVIITTLYVSFFPIVEIIDFIRKYNQTARIIVGGPFVATQVQAMAARELEYLFGTMIGADFYVNSSQGESTLVNIIAALKNKLPLREIPNIYYKTGDTLNVNPTARENNRLSENMVDWDLFSGDIGEYANIRTSISCPFSCSFCGFPRHAGPYQTVPVELIEKGLRKLEKAGTVKMVHFIDDTFNIPVKRYKEIMRMIAANRFGFQWHGFFRSQFADEEMVALMKRAGCAGVYLGLESGNNEILKNMKKAVRVENYLQGIHLLKKYDIVTYGNFIIGFPGETGETVTDTIEFIKTAGLDFFRAQLWYCEPITPIWQERERYGITGESFEWTHATMNSRTACDWVERIFQSVDSPTWVPQYNFCFDGIWHLVNRGMSLDRVKDFLNGFNRAIREKLAAPPDGEAGYEILRQLRQAGAGPGSGGENSHEDDVTQDGPGDDPDGDFDF